MSLLIRRIEEVRERVTRAAHAAGRAPETVRLLPISKTFPAEAVLEAARAGLDAFGENRVQEAAQKISQVRAADGAELEWHLVGPLQRNKARKAVELFHVIQSVDRIELALALEHAAAALGKCQRILLNVNVDEEPQKSGVLPADLTELLARIDALPHLEPLGLMSIPRRCTHAEEVRPCFARLRGLQEELNRGRSKARLSELSMGMSADFEVAIHEGSTIVRIGTAIFGARRSE